MLHAITSYLGTIPPLVTALISIMSLGVTAMSGYTQWRALRGLKDPRLLTADERMKRIAFWMAWYDAQQKVQQIVDLERSKETIRANLQLLSNFDELPTSDVRATGNAIRRIFLLDASSGHKSIDVVRRMPFYISLVLSAAITLGFLPSLIAKPSTEDVIVYVGLNVLAYTTVLGARRLYKLRLWGLSS